MTSFRPQYISFDCYGTLIRFHMSEMAREFFADRLPPEAMDEMCRKFSAYRFDETLDTWKPYRELIRNAVRRTAKAFGVEYREADADSIYEMVPQWGPHPDVPGGLAKIADKIPLVILSNAMDEQIPHNVAKLGAPFHRVYTAQQAQAYKPRLRAFEYMLDQLGCAPEEILHVSSSMRYDHLSAADMGINNRAFVARGHEPPCPAYGAREIPDIGGLPALVGL